MSHFKYCACKLNWCRERQIQLRKNREPLPAKFSLPRSNPHRQEVWKKLVADFEAKPEPKQGTRSIAFLQWHLCPESFEWFTNSKAVDRRPQWRVRPGQLTVSLEEQIPPPYGVEADWDPQLQQWIPKDPNAVISAGGPPPPPPPPATIKTHFHPPPPPHHHHSASPTSSNSSKKRPLSMLINGGPGEDGGNGEDREMVLGESAHGSATINSGNPPSPPVEPEPLPPRGLGTPAHSSQQHHHLLHHQEPHKFRQFMPSKKQRIVDEKTYETSLKYIHEKCEATGDTQLYNSVQNVLDYFSNSVATADGDDTGEHGQEDDEEQQQQQGQVETV